MNNFARPVFVFLTNSEGFSHIKYYFSSKPSVFFYIKLTSSNVEKVAYFFKIFFLKNC